MNIYGIEIEWYVIVFAIGISLLVLAISSPKTSPSTLRKIINDYSSFLNDCNELTNSINKTIDRLTEKVFDASSDENAAIDLVQKYNWYFNEIRICNESFNYYIKKKNIKKYKKCKKEAEIILN